MTLLASKHDLTATAWPSPNSLIPEQEIAPYPVQCLPNIIRDAVLAYQQYGQQPMPLIASSALANVSLACQTLANVARDRLLVSPVSLYFIIVASSGERKSAADHALGQAIRHWELEVKAKIAPEVLTAQTLHQAWRAEKEGILTQIRRAAILGSDDSNILKQRFVDIMANEPSVPLAPALFFEDVTQEALASHLAHGWPSASLWSDEGGIILGGQGMHTNSTKFVALLNRLWDGKAFTTHRKTTKSFTVSNRRLSLSVMLQPLLLQQMLAKNKGINRHSGFMARCLLTYPSSAMGERYYQEPPQTLAALPYFHARLIECLNSSLHLDKAGCHTIPTLTFSPHAKAAWILFFNQLEAGLKPGGQWIGIKDFASKAAENAARLAALFHLFTGIQSSISHESVEQAIEIIRWHLLETKLILCQQPQSLQQQDAIKLWQWILDKTLTETSVRELRQYSPIREKNRLDNAVQLLMDNHYLRETSVNKKTFLVVNPQR